MSRSILAGWRRLLHALLAPVCREGTYAAPEGAAGYRGWVRAPGVGTLAFRPIAGPLQYRW